MPQVDRSIHPRAWPDFKQEAKKSNTCKTHKGGGKLAKKMKNLLRRRNDHSLTLKSLTGRQNPAGFKTPGSMNLHK